MKERCGILFGCEVNFRTFERDNDVKMWRLRFVRVFDTNDDIICGIVVVVWLFYGYLW